MSPCALYLLPVSTVVNGIVTMRFKSHYWGLPGGSNGNEFACNAGDLGLIPWLGRSLGGGHGNPLQYSCLENPMDRGAGWTTVPGVTKNLTRLNEVHSLLQITTHCINVIHSSFCFSCSLSKCLRKLKQLEEFYISHTEKHN